MTEIGFDVIGELNIEPGETFSWSDKVSSLYCIISGNISSDPKTLIKVLTHLSTLYQGVFYVAGTLEYHKCASMFNRLQELIIICESIPNVCFLHQHVAIINGVAVMGANGWGTSGNLSDSGVLVKTANRQDDIRYISESIRRLQRHPDVKNIVMVTNAVPDDYLYFGEKPKTDIAQIPLSESLELDSEHKISHWVFGSYNKSVDTYYNGINYINNPYERNSPYYAKRITIEI